MREVSFTAMAVFLIFTSLKGTSLVFSLLSLLVGWQSWFNAADC